MQVSDRPRARRLGRAAAPKADASAVAVLDVVPTVVRFIRHVMLRHRGLGLSVPQFRTLALLSRTPQVSLSCVADNIGASLPAASRMIGVLVAKKLVVREGSKGDRRQLALGLTARGAQVFSAARDEARRQLAEQLGALGPDDHQRICGGLQVLGNIFGTDARPLLTASSVGGCGTASPAGTGGGKPRRRRA